MARTGVWWDDEQWSRSRIHATTLSWIVTCKFVNAYNNVSVHSSKTHFCWRVQAWIRVYCVVIIKNWHDGISGKPIDYSSRKSHGVDPRCSSDPIVIDPPYRHIRRHFLVVGVTQSLQIRRIVTSDVTSYSDHTKFQTTSLLPMLFQLTILLLCHFLTADGDLTSTTRTQALRIYCPIGGEEEKGGGGGVNTI